MIEKNKITKSNSRPKAVLNPLTLTVRGSAMVAVLVILAVALLATTALVQNVLIDTDMSFNLKKSDEAYNNAISSIEEANLRLIRDPAFSGATLNFANGSATIEVTNVAPDQRQISIISRVNNDKYICQMQALANYDAEGNLTVSEIREIY